MPGVYTLVTSPCLQYNIHVCPAVRLYSDSVMGYAHVLPLAYMVFTKSHMCMYGLCVACTMGYVYCTVGSPIRWALLLPN